MKQIFPAILLIALLVVFSWAAPRLEGLLPGFSPLPPLFFCVAASMASRWIWLPAVAWTLSYFLINYTQGYELSLQALVIIASLVVTFWIGALFRNKSMLHLTGGALLAALGFYVVANTGSWLLSQQYAKTWQGWMQAQTIGLPGYVPAWMFLKGQLVASGLFTPLFLLGQRRFGVIGRKSPEGATANESW